MVSFNSSDFVRFSQINYRPTLSFSSTPGKFFYFIFLRIIFTQFVKLKTRIQLTRALFISSDYLRFFG